MADQGYSRTLTFVVNDKQIKRATDRLFQSLDKIEKKIDQVVGKYNREVQVTYSASERVAKSVNTQLVAWKAVQETAKIASGLVAAMYTGLIAVKGGVEGLVKWWQQLNETIGQTLQRQRKPLNELNAFVSKLRSEMEGYHSSSEKAKNTALQLASVIKVQVKEQAALNNLVNQGLGKVSSGIVTGRNRAFGRRYVGTPDEEAAKMRNRAINERRSRAIDARFWRMKKANQKLEKASATELLRLEKERTNQIQTQINSRLRGDPTAYAPGAVGPRQSLYNRLGFGAAADPQGVFANSRGIGGRRANAVSSGLIGGFFPLLFGQGGMAAGAGAAGGAAGGALGGAFGFAGSIAATAIAQKIQEAIDYRKAIDKLNKSIRLTGGDSEFSVRSMNALAKQLNVTKEEALQAAQSFEAFGAAARINLIQVFGDEATFNSLKNIRKTLDVLQNINLIEKRIGKERANQALYIGLARGGLAAQRQILEDMFNLEEEEAKEKGGKLKGRRKFMATLSSMGQTLLGQGGKRNPYIAKLQEENIDDAVSDVLSKQAAATRTFNEELRRLGSQEIVEKIAGPRDALEELMDPLNQLVGLSQSVGDSFSESFRGIISGSMTAQEALANLFRRTADHFADMAARMIAEQIKMQIMGIGLKLLQPQGLAPFRGANTGGTDIYGRDYDAPAFGLPSRRSFADGGRPPVGRASIVGERGPELFVPDSAGTIIPNHAVGGANVVVNVDATGTAVQGDSGQAEQLGSMLAEAVQAELVKQQRPGGILARSR